MNDAQKSFLIKIIPPSGYSVYRLHLTWRHVAGITLALLVALVGASAYHTYQLRIAAANVRALQSLTAQQQSKLRTIDKQADDLTNQLRAVQKENAEIKRLIGGDHDAHGQHVFAPPKSGARRADFAAVQARLRSLARASEATRDDAKRLQQAAMRVLNLRHLASIARERMLAAIPSINPVGGGVASSFGWRTYPWPEFHKGLDLEADYGTPVHAGAAGTVVSAGWEGSFGIKVDIDHGNGYHTWYAHLSRVNVSPGQRVTKGESIAFSGSTGESTGPHLHYQVMYQGEPIDPAPFLNGVPEKVMATLPDSSGV